MPDAASTALAPVRPLSAGAGERRLGWLDALRGIAVLFVVFEHLSFSELTGVRAAVDPWFSPGLYGVMVFFMVSGYIVPSSLEQRGSVRRFWVSRVFRLYPLFAVVVLIKIVLASSHLATDTVTDAGASAVAHILMLQDLLGVTNLINVLWTLSFEMAFYLLLTFLFVAGAHRASAGVATAFAAGSLALGAILPQAALSRSFAGTPAAATAAILLGLAGAVSGHRRLRPAGAALAGATALVLLSFNSRVGAWEGFAILAAMFTGTVLHRAERGQIGWPKALATAAAVYSLTAISGWWHQAGSGATAASDQRQWAISILLAAATFAAGMVWRKRDPPYLLTWIGMISYSVYLIHMLMIDILVRLPWTQPRPPLAGQAAITAAFLGLLLGCCWLTYRYVEAPMQRLGRRAAQRLEARFGQDLLTAGPGGRPAGAGRHGGARDSTRRGGSIRPVADGIRLMPPGGAGQDVPFRERFGQARRDRQRREPSRGDPGSVHGVVAGGELPAGDDGSIVTDVEYRSAGRGPQGGADERSRHDR